MRSCHHQKAVSLMVAGTVPVTEWSHYVRTTGPPPTITIRIVNIIRSDGSSSNDKVVNYVEVIKSGCEKI